jgi:hypothetical protein
MLAFTIVPCTSPRLATRTIMQNLNILIEHCVIEHGYIMLRIYGGKYNEHLNRYVWIDFNTRTACNYRIVP